MYFKYDPLNEFYKSVRGGVAENTNVLFKVESDASCVTLRIYGDNGHIDRLLTKNGNFFECSLSFERGLFFYVFIADEVVFGGDKQLIATANGNPWQLTVYPSDYCTPDWIKGNIIYQIFPDRFCKAGDFSVGKGKVKRYDWGGMPVFKSPDGVVRNNEFFGGNFKGILSKLDYLKKLGVGAVYLNPICESYSSHRYDTGDYLMPDSVLGTIEDFKELTKQGKKHGISFIFDGVFNHTGAGSRYFNKYNDYNDVGAYNSPQSPYSDWYTFKSFPDEYECWWNFKTLPSIKKDSKDFQDFVCGKNGVIEFWKNAGIGGMRLDVVDELTDDFTARIRKTLKHESADNLLIGEVWEDATNKMAYGVRRKYFTDGELDSVMNYPLRDAIINYVLGGDCEFLAQTVNSQINNYPPCALDSLMNILSTHDSPRIITVLGRRKVVLDKNLMASEVLDDYEYQSGKLREKLASVLQFFLYGVPSVYYGDEEGLQGDLDPYNRKCFDWNNMDCELLSHYLKLSKIRKANKAFVNGKTQIIYKNKGVFVFSRGEGYDKIIIALNSGLRTYSLTFSEQAINLYTERTANNFELSPMSFVVLKKV